MEINMIVAADEAWGIGYQNQLLYHLKEDMKQFREKTIGNVVVMGRKTLESLPGGRPLPERTNVVLSRNCFDELQQREDVKRGELLVASSVEDVWQLLSDEEKAIYIIGGEQIYQEFLEYANRIYLTKIFGRKKADAFFPNIEVDSKWRVISESERMQEENVSFSFVCYENIKEEK